jgi:nitroreductase
VTARTPDHPVDPLFLDRWSPRAFDGSPIPDAELMTMFEAARWAPSAFNAQPWHFLYAKRGDANWARFLSLLVPFNQAWAHTASVLIYIVSDSTPTTDRDGKPKASATHAFDTGAAWVSLALQATRMGYFTHGMSGIDHDRARAELGLTDRYQLNAACVIGKRGDPGQLDEKQRARELPSDRKPQGAFVHAGNWPAGLR